VFDHTSLIQFIEQRFGARSPGLRETNITPWRRAVAGDLTSAFNFATPNDVSVPLPSTVSYRPPDEDKHPDYSPVPPLAQSLPEQEPGTRPARALPYETQVWADIDLSQAAVNIHFRNSGKAAAVFQVRSLNSDAGPWTYTVGAQSELSDAWVSPVIDLQAYELSVHGPNGFLRCFKGGISGNDKSNLNVASVYDVERCGIALRVRNGGESPCRVSILDGYGKETTAHDLKAGETLEKYWPLASTFGWYDLAVEVESNSAFRQHLAGHVETGEDSRSDPGLGPASGHSTG
jgi:phospholipase C